MRLRWAEVVVRPEEESMVVELSVVAAGFDGEFIVMVTRSKFEIDLDCCEPHGPAFQTVENVL